MKRIILAVGFYLSTILACLYAQQVLPMDPEVRYGKLPNGLTYYIRHSESNGDYVDMYLLQNVGSVLEEEHERGLAHFLEHMAFNGTRNFPGLSVRQYLDNKGLVLGAHYNASTSYDATEYYIREIPTEDEGMVDTCLMIIRDMSSYLTLDENMIEKERLIVESEWHQDNTPESQIAYNRMNKLFPNGEKYGTNHVIGSLDVIKNFKPETLRDFYRKWHRPDLQAVVVIGDVDVDAIEEQIIRLWAEIPAPSNPLPREEIEVSLHKGIIPIVEIGKDVSFTSVLLGYKVDDMPLSKKGTYEDYKLVVEYLMLKQVMNLRLARMYNNNKSVFLGVEFSREDYYGARWIDEYYVMTLVYPDKWQEALRLLETEVKQLRTYGVGQMEFDQAKEYVAKMFESGVRRVDNKVNTDYYNEIQSHFLDKEVLVDQRKFYAKLIEIVDTFTIADFNNHVFESFSDDNIVVSLLGNNELSPLVTEPQLAQLYNDNYAQIEVEPIDRAFRSLIPNSNLLDSSQIVEQRVDSGEVYDTHHLTLSNGAKVVLRYCDVETDKITIVGYRKGGMAMFEEKDYDNYNFLEEIIGCGGLGENRRDDIDLWYQSSNYVVELSFDVNDEMIMGVSSHDGLEPMLTHMQLLFGSTTKDISRFNQWEAGCQELLKMTNKSPDGIFSDSIIVAEHGQQNPYMPVYSSRPVKFDYDRACEMFELVFSDASEFTFIIVGDMNLDEMKEHIVKYIGTIPRQETKRVAVEPLIIRSLPGYNVVDFECEAYESELNKMNYRIIAPIESDGANIYASEILELLLNEYLVEELREKRGVIYSPQVTVSVYREPTNEVCLNVLLDVTPGYEELSKKLIDDFLDMISRGEFLTDRYNVHKNALLRDADYKMGTASFPLQTALEEVMYGTKFKRYEYIIISYLDEEDVKTVASALAESDCRKLVIMRPSSNK